MIYSDGKTLVVCVRVERNIASAACKTSSLDDHITRLRGSTYLIQCHLSSSTFSHSLSVLLISPLLSPACTLRCFVPKRSPAWIPLAAPSPPLLPLLPLTLTASMTSFRDLSVSSVV